MSILRFVRTLRHLRASQIVARLRYQCARPRPDHRPPPPRRVLGIDARRWVPQPARAACMTGPDRVRVLQVERTIASAGDWDDPAVPKLWRYHLHYFDDLIASGASKRRTWHQQLMSRWIAENIPATGSGWEPYPVSRRIPNWIAWEFSAEAPRGELSQPAIASLAVQARWLSKRIEWHLLGNHVLANAKALLFAGVFFQGPEADAWRSIGSRIFDDELKTQVLPDGGHDERSPMYHALILNDLLDVINLHQYAGMDVPACWREIAQRMLSWLGTMTFPDGDIVLFNDAAFDIAPSSHDLFTYARGMGMDIPDRVTGAPLTMLPDTGYLRLERGGAVVAIDFAAIGPDHQPGHGHADTLTFELSLGQQRVVVDSGTSEYGLSPERLRQRGTAAHNTITVDHQDSSEVWAGFRVARRARVTDVMTRSEADRVIAAGTHDGYRRLRGVGDHRREFSLTDHTLTVTDSVTGTGMHHVACALHLHPDIRVTMHANRAELSRGDEAIAVMVLDPCLQWSLEATTWHPRFGEVVPNMRIVGRNDVRLPIQTLASISW